MATFGWHAVLLLAAAPLAGPARAPTPARASRDVTIPFECARRTIFLRATVNGTPFWFVLDTGLGVTLIDLAAAKAAGARSSTIPPRWLAPASSWAPS